MRAAQLCVGIYYMPALSRQKWPFSSAADADDRRHAAPRYIFARALNIAGFMRAYHRHDFAPPIFKKTRPRAPPPRHALYGQ